MRASLFLVLGPSGVGKSSLVERVLSDYPNIKYQPSWTTRQPRVGEKNGQHYNFVDLIEFKLLKNENAFIEIDQPHGTYYYGIAKEPLFTELKSGIPFIKEVGFNGLQSFMHSSIKEAVTSVFVKPINFKELELRLRERGGKDIDERLKLIELEMKTETHCNYSITIKQGDFDFGYSQLKNIINHHLTE